MNDIAIEPEALSSPPLIADDGSMRRVGIEVEFLGPSAQVAAEALAHDLGGACVMVDPHAFKITGTGLGDLLIETDLRHVHPDRHPELGLRLGPQVADWLGTLASPFVPRELITTPIPITQLPKVNTIVHSLRAAGAYGRGAVLWDSLGLHFNIDPPRLDAATVTAFLKAFLLVSDRLREDIARGSFRRALVLPPDYPLDYKRQVLDPDYWPDLPHLTDDYLAANPTRRRALDLLPLLTHFDHDRVRSVLPHEKIGPRPVFHYRLPQAYLSDPAWSIMPDWERWLSVERLAMNPDVLTGTGQAAPSRHLS
jgi:hypothetical protein